MPRLGLSVPSPPLPQDNVDVDFIQSGSTIASGGGGEGELEKLNNDFPLQNNASPAGVLSGVPRPFGQDCSLILGITSPFLVDLFKSTQDCYNGTGETYTGRMNVTKSGRPCLEWPDKDLPHNFCRNPKGLRARPWCFVGPDNEKELCDIEKCSAISK